MSIFRLLSFVFRFSYCVFRLRFDWFASLQFASFLSSYVIPFQPVVCIINLIIPCQYQTFPECQRKRKCQRRRKGRDQLTSTLR
jgi:hypothetical protein